MTRNEARKIMSSPPTILCTDLFRDRDALLEIQHYKPAGYLPASVRCRRHTIWGAGDWQHVSASKLEPKP